MGQFIILSRQRDATDAITDPPKQLQVVDEILGSQQIGGARSDIYWTAGAYDLVLIAEFPHVAAATACALIMRRALAADTTLLTPLGRDDITKALAELNPPSGRRPATGR